MTTPHAHRRSRRPTTTITGATLALAGLVGLAACGDDADASLAAGACDAAVGLGSAFASAPQDPAATRAFANEQLVPIGATLESTLEGDAADSASVLADAFATIADTGDLNALFDDPATAEAQSAIGRAVHDSCDLQAIDVTAVEYAYQGAPDEVDAGRVSFALTNDGVEAHEMVLFRRADGVTDPFDTIAQLPEEEQMTKLTFTGVAFGDPGTTTYTALDLEPGTYFLVCFLPQGGEAGGGDGAPHFMAGMQHTLVVT